MLESRPPPHVLMIYAADGVDYAGFFATSGFALSTAQSALEGFERAIALRATSSFWTSASMASWWHDYEAMPRPARFPSLP